MTKKEKYILFRCLEVILDKCLWRPLMEADNIKPYNDEIYNLLNIIKEIKGKIHD